MWFRKASPRRQAIREDVAEVESLASPIRRQTGHIFVIATVFMLVAVALQFWPRDPLPYHAGERSPMDLRSPVTFTIEDPAETEHLRDATRVATPAVLIADRTAFDAIYGQLNNLKYNLEGIRSFGDVPPAVQKRFPALTEESFHRIQSLNSSVFETDARTLVYRTLPNIPLLSKDDYTQISERHSDQLALITTPTLPDSMVQISLQYSFPLSAPDDNQQRTLRGAIADNFPEGFTDVIASFLLTVEQPTFHFDPKLTTDLADRRASHMQPFGRRIKQDDVIVPRGTVITDANYQTLLAAQRELRKSIAQSRPWAPWAAGFGRALIIAILTFAGALYVARLSDVAQSAKQGWTVCALLLLTLIPARIIVSYWPQGTYVVGMLPTLLTAIILTIAYNQRFALGLSALHALLVTVTLNQGLDFFLPLLAGSAAFCFALKEIRTLGRLLEVGFFYAAPSIMVTVLSLGFVRMIGFGAMEIGDLAMTSLAGAGAGLIAAGLSLFFLRFIERMFNVTTSMTMLEWCDASKPLLRRLAQEASGTFNHSLTVGIMAEAAGNAIGANGLLCRVGAYYHDVGKLSKPQYFIENQSPGGPNRHDKLSPAMSLLIIVGHVKDGIELAREYKLPHIIHQFIGQHHGTTLVEYFYHAAKKKQEQQGEDLPQISDTEFRYPGPKPQSREAAIIMICDACESIVRSIEEPTPGRIESAVHSIIMKRLMDGQFAECNLTLRELSVIEDTLIRTLAGVHHGRVAYPSNPKPALSRPA